jgi:hypothetical protein
LPDSFSDPEGGFSTFWTPIRLHSLSHTPEKNTVYHHQCQNVNSNTAYTTSQNAQYSWHYPKHKNGFNHYHPGTVNLNLILLQHWQPDFSLVVMVSTVKQCDTMPPRLMSLEQRNA